MKKIVIILVILLVVIGGWFSYKYLFTTKFTCWPYCPNMTDQDRENIKKSAKEAENLVAKKQTDNNPLETTVVSGGEDSTTEVFKNQPGAIKSITNQSDSQWLLSVDLLTRNTHWVPGGESDFFLNQNPQIRSLLVTKETKTYECNGVNADALRNTSKFMSDIQVGMIKRDEESKKFGTKAYDYTSYFDINGSNIIAIYQQCLP